MKKLSDIENLEFTREDISLMGLIFLAFIALLHTDVVGFVITVPVTGLLVFICIEKYLRDIFTYLRMICKRK